MSLSLSAFGASLRPRLRTRRRRPAPLCPHRRYLAASAAPAEVGFHGGTAVVNGRVKNAATCQLQLLSHQGFPVVFASNKRPCTSTFSARVTIGANPSTVARTVAFELIAQNGGKSFGGRFYVTLAPMVAPPPPPVSATISVSPDALPSSGGDSTLSWTAPNAIICTLSVSGPVSPSSYGAPDSSLADLISASPQNVLCDSDVSLPIGAGSSSTQQWAFTLTAGTLAAGSAKATTTLVETTLRTSLTAIPPGSPVQQTDSNWAGYGVSGGPYTSVEGTFTVPSLAPGTLRCHERMGRHRWAQRDKRSGGLGPSRGVGEHASLRWHLHVPEGRL